MVVRRSLVRPLALFPFLALVPLLATVAGCRDDHASAPAAGPSTPRSDEVTAFCDGWDATLTSGDDTAMDELLAHPPHGLEEAAAALRQANAGAPAAPDGAVAADGVLDWIELHCPRGEPGDSQRVVAPPVDAGFDGLTYCGTISSPGRPSDERSGTVLYGEVAADDPYAGPMLGVFWNPSDEANHAGDGDGQPVTVRGQGGVAAPITVFQQTVLPELGTVIAWTERDRSFGLYGRLWPIERAGELVEIANQLEGDARGFHVPDRALPPGYGEVFPGDPSALSIVLVPSPLYSLHYQADGGLLSVHGLQMDADAFEAFRFLTMGVDRSDVAGRDARIGNAWHADGPAVVTWREPDGLVVRVVGIGVPLDIARSVADRSRELSTAEWTALVTADARC